MRLDSHLASEQVKGLMKTPRGDSPPSCLSLFLGVDLALLLLFGASLLFYFWLLR